MKDKIRMGPAKKVYSGIIFDIVRKDVEFPNGNKKIFEFCVRGDNVTILPFDKKGRLLLIKERRHDFTGSKIIWFLPAGRVDKGENSLTAAKRELREEVGLGAKIIKKMYTNKSMGHLVSRSFIFVAKDLYPAPLKGDEDFSIEVVPTSLKKAVQMAIDGTIEHEFIAYHIIRFYYMLKHGKFKW